MYLQRHYSKFINQVGTDLGAYYQVPEVKIQVIPINDVSFSVTFRSERPFVPLLFAPEIRRLIAAYLRREHLTCSVVYPREYPFKPPHWMVESADTTDIIARHNNAYKHFWDTTYTIDKDILLVLIEYLNK